VKTEIIPDVKVEELLPHVRERSTSPVSPVLLWSGAGVSAHVIEQCVALEWVVSATPPARLPRTLRCLLRSATLVRRVRPDLVYGSGECQRRGCWLNQLRQWQVRTVSWSGAGLVADPDDSFTSLRRTAPPRDCGRSCEFATTPRNGETPRMLWRAGSNQWRVRRVHSTQPAGRPSGRGNDKPLRAWRSSWIVDARTRRRVVGASARECHVRNRGVNGIDGVVSRRSGGRRIKGVGPHCDLTMLHDVVGAGRRTRRRRGTCVLVVVDNRGGGIFSFLPKPGH